MDENLKTFLTKLADDKELFAEFQDLVKDKAPSEELDKQVIRLANDHGIPLTKEDIKPLENVELPDEELAGVAGGASGPNSGFVFYMLYKDRGGSKTYGQWVLAGCPINE